jgi:hypothetical protein
MSFIAPVGQSNPQLSDALKRLSAAKYGKPRQQAEKEIFTRLGAADAEKKAKADALKKAQQERMTGMSSRGPQGGGSSFLDEWLAKRKQIAGAPKPPAGPSSAPSPFVPSNLQPGASALPPQQKPSMQSPVPASPEQPPLQQPSATQTPPAEDKLHLRGDKTNPDSEISIKLR